MKSMKSSRPGCATPSVSRCSQHHPNPAPGSSPGAAAAAKADAAKRNTVESTFRKLFPAPTPTPTPNPQSAGAIADRRDQEKKLRGEY